MLPALVGVVLLSLWLGAAVIVAAAVAPAAFAVLPTRILAGALVGRVLPVVFWAGIVVGIAAAGFAWSATAGRLAVAGAALCSFACAVAQLVIAPRIETIRQAIAGPVDALDPGDARRMAFGRLHGLSVLSMGVAALGALVALIVLTRFIA